MKAIRTCSEARLAAKLRKNLEAGLLNAPVLMPRSNLDDIAAFIAVARAQSFTRAAAQLGVSQSALSQTVRGLEARLGLRLLTRTTRSVSPTEAGERLLQAAEPRIGEIEAELAALSVLREKPSGTIRITAHDHAAQAVLLPALGKLLPDYPDINVEIVIDYGLTDIAAERFDAGIRSGEQVAKDMIAVGVGPDLRSAVVGAPSYFARRPKPKAPPDLTAHNCINLRLPTHGGLYAWEFERGTRALRVRVEGQLVSNGSATMLDAALAGLGLAYLPEQAVQEHLAAGRLIRVLADWCPPYPGYHLYYPSRRQPTPAFALLVELLRYVPGRR
jgi:DNA-binding transcriptional LysR family regulator